MSIVIVSVSFVVLFELSLFVTLLVFWFVFGFTSPEFCELVFSPVIIWFALFIKLCCVVLLNSAGASPVILNTGIFKSIS